MIRKFNYELISFLAQLRFSRVLGFPAENFSVNKLVNIVNLVAGCAKNCCRSNNKISSIMYIYTYILMTYIQEMMGMKILIEGHIEIRKNESL